MKGTNRHFIITLIVLAAIFGLIILWNIIRGIIIEHTIASLKPIPAVSIAKAQKETWHPRLYSIGTIGSFFGVNVSSQESGNVVSINFRSGQKVKRNDILAILDHRVEQAQLQNYIAAAKLAEITYLRNKELAQKGAVSRQACDEASARYQQALANVAQVQAIIDYKHIRAPFDGKIGIRNIALGQYLRPGDAIASLQALDTLNVLFYLPDKHLHQLYVGQPLIFTVDAIPKRKFSGSIHAINSLIDTQTHNIAVEAVVPNVNEKLYPGLFARTQVILPVKKNVITIPQTSINYTLYGNTVYVLKRDKNKKGKEILTVVLREVTTGDEKDNKIIITQGLKAGEEVVTSGQLKLRNNEVVVINNSVKPT